MDGAVKLTPREGERGWSRWSAYLWSKKEYQDFEIQFELTVKLNGEVVNEVDLTTAPLASRPKKGPIGFQDHALPVWLKDIKIREL